LSSSIPRVMTNVGLYYNRLGSRIIEVATNFEDDILEEARNVLDMTVTQPLFNGRYELKFSVRNMLSEDQIFTQAKDIIRRNQEPTSYSIGFSIKL
jgi:hypothetical protein